MQKLERVLTYLDKMPAAIAGSNGDKATYRAAIACKRFGLTVSEIWTAMQWFNENKCQPRWSEKELRHKVDDANGLHINKPLDQPQAFTQRRGPAKMFVAPEPVVKKEDTRPVIQRSAQEEEYRWEQVAASRGVTLPEWDEVAEEANP